MLISLAKIVQDGPLGGSSGGVDSVEDILQAMSTGDAPIVAVHPTRSVRSRLVIRLVHALREENVRVIQTTSAAGEKIDLINLMDQVVGETCEDTIERSERCYASLTNARDAETRICLIVEDAHLVTSKALEYLDLVASLGRSGQVPLHIILVGDEAIRDRLPPAGGFSVDRGALHIAISDEVTEPDRLAGHIAIELAVADQPVPAPIGETEAADPGMALESTTVNQRSIVGASLSRQVMRRRFAAAVCASVVVAGICLTPNRSIYEAFMSRDGTTTVTADKSRTAIDRTGWFGTSGPSISATPVVAIVQRATARPLPPNMPNQSDDGAAANAAEPSRMPPAATIITPVVALTAIAGPNQADAVPSSPSGPDVSPAAVQSDTAAMPRSAVPPNAALATPASPAAGTDTVPTPTDPDVVPVLIERGDWLLATGDVTAARLMYQRAAGSGAARGAVALGMTYDPIFLARIGAHGIAANPTRALSWYRRAADLGNAEAVRLIAQLQSSEAK